VDNCILAAFIPKNHLFLTGHKLVHQTVIFPLLLEGSVKTRQEDEMYKDVF
jgi:hypothetical protein